MKKLHLLRWSGCVLSPRTRLYNQTRLLLTPSTLSRFQSTATAALQYQNNDEIFSPSADLSKYPSPPPNRASSSARLSALHARLMLSPRLPLETLARCLVDSTADPNPHFNNASLAQLGKHILGYHTSEYILCKYPRLPLSLIFATMKAYVGPQTLGAITREWGVEVAAEPGGEVDPGLLQFKRIVSGNADLDGTGVLVKDAKDSKKASKPWNRGITNLTTFDEYFGEVPPHPKFGDVGPPRDDGVTLEDASMEFVRAVTGALYLHCGREAAKAFFRAHIESRQLDVGQMFYFRQPTRDLSRLCAREGLESPIARILSETGRMSRTPVFVVGVFSGKDKLGEGAGSSLDEARIRAAIGALKGWYLYSPLKLRVPSDVEGDGEKGKKWEPVLIDGGEVIV